MNLPMTSIGVDIVEVERFRNASEINRMLELFLTSNEIANMKERVDLPQFAASRFALKEAVIKAIPEHISPLDFEIIKLDKGELKSVQPAIHFVNPKYEKYEGKVAVSLSHTTSSAIGFALVE